MKEKIIQKIFGDETELRARVFRVILLASACLSIMGILESFFMNGDRWMGVAAVLFLVAIGIAMLLTFRFHKMETAAFFVGLLIIVVFFPLVFFVSGGIDGGATVWFVLGIVYVFLMFSGLRMYVFLSLALIVDVGTYVIGYLHPELIQSLGSPSAEYMDSMFSVFSISIALGLIMRFQAISHAEERRRTQEQAREIQQISHAKDVFFAKVSHEIRTPVNTIIGLNEMNLRNSGLPHETIENCVSIGHASDMILDLVNEVLDMSQIEAGKMSFFESAYQTKQLIYNLVDLIQVRLEEKNLNFVVHVDENVPQVLMGDEKRIRQILVNLLSNAVKYTPEGSVTLEVHTEELADNRVALSVSVADTGIGIRKEDIQYLYDYFHRVDAGTTHTIEGSGLGLSITKQLVDLMGGKMTVDSIYHEGSTFSVRIPQMVVDRAPIGHIDFLSRDRGNRGVEYVPSFEASEARILLVDDNRMNLEVLKKLLADTKIHIDTAMSGREALDMTAKFCYDVIFMDYMMPEMNGLEALQEIRKQNSGLCQSSPVVCLTGDVRPDINQNGIIYNFDNYLQKPITGEKMEEEILRYLPEDLLEFRREDAEEQRGETSAEGSGYAGGITKRKRRICISTDCSSDLAQEFVDRYEIRQMYPYIETSHGRFLDTLEIDSNILTKYLSENESNAKAVAASVEDYEKYFAELLTESEDVIHIGLAKSMGQSYSNALTAARSFERVHVIDSGHISGGIALMVIKAGQMAAEGAAFAEIMDCLERMKDIVSSTFLLPTASICRRNGYARGLSTQIMDYFQVHPLLKLKDSRLVIYGFHRGSLDRARKRYIDARLFNKGMIDSEILYVTHVACSVRELDMVLSEIRKCYSFEKIIVQKASVSNACNTGLGTLGIAYFNKMDKKRTGGE